MALNKCRSILQDIGIEPDGLNGTENVIKTIIELAENCMIEDKPKDEEPSTDYLVCRNKEG